MQYVKLGVMKKGFLFALAAAAALLIACNQPAANVDSDKGGNAGAEPVAVDSSLSEIAWIKEDYAADMVAAAVIGGIIGAKLWYVALTGDPDALLSRGGLVWYGGFIGGALAVILNSWRLRVPLRWTTRSFVPR